MTVSAGAGRHDVVHASHVTWRRGERTILDDVSVAVSRGEHWALIGPNGGGKSSLVSILSAMTHPTSGTVDILGHRMGRVDVRELRARIGLVTSRHPLGSDLDALSVAVTGATGTLELVPRWSPPVAVIERALALLERFGIRTPRDLRWSTMSQGERARVLVCRALLADPALLIMDEAATGLDVAGREQLLDAVDALAHDHPALATITVTHHLEELPRVTTHALLLRAGRVVARGPVREVLTDAHMSACFTHPIRVSDEDGRWTARTRREAVPASPARRM